MKHTPFGYNIVNGRAVVNEREAATIRAICRNYLAGMSLKKSAEEAGVIMGHSGVSNLLSNRRYLGDDHYPEVIDTALFDRVQEELDRRKKARGRNGRSRKKNGSTGGPVYYIVPKIKQEYDDPVLQAEYAYSQVIEAVLGMK